MSTLVSLKDSLRSRTNIMETLLGRITLLVQDLAQHIEYTDYIKRINELYFEATSSLLTIGSEQRNDIEPTELTTFKSSMANIETKTSTSNAALYA